MATDKCSENFYLPEKEVNSEKNALEKSTNVALIQTILCFCFLRCYCCRCRRRRFNTENLRTPLTIQPWYIAIPEF